MNANLNSHRLPCGQWFERQGMDGLRATELDPPICRNNNGKVPIILDSFCTDLRHAMEFVQGGFKYHRDWAVEKCHDGADISDLPVCEYDCDHPTICIQTGRYDLYSGDEQHSRPSQVLLCS